MKSQLGHLQINVNLTNLGFYKDLFHFLDWTTLCDEPTMFGAIDADGVSLGFGGSTKEVINDYDGPGTNHIAIAVSNKDEVDQAVSYLGQHKIGALFDTPCHRPEFCADPTETYYQVMFESPDRLLFEIYYSGPLAN